MEHQRGRRQDQTGGVEAEGTGEVGAAPGTGTGGTGAGGGTTSPEVETGRLGGVGTEGIPSGREDWPEREPGTSGSPAGEDEPSGRVGP